MGALSSLELVLDPTSFHRCYRNQRAPSQSIVSWSYFQQAPGYNRRAQIESGDKKHKRHSFGLQLQHEPEHGSPTFPAAPVAVCTPVPRRSALWCCSLSARQGGPGVGLGSRVDSELDRGSSCSKFMAMGPSGRRRRRAPCGQQPQAGGMARVNVGTRLGGATVMSSLATNVGPQGRCRPPARWKLRGTKGAWPLWCY